MKIRRSSAPQRVLLAAEAPLLRAALRCLIDGFGGVTVSAEAADSREAAALAKRHRPDAVVLAGDEVAEAAAEIRRCSSRSKIFIVPVSRRSGTEFPPLPRENVELLPAGATPRDLERRLRPAMETNGKGRVLTPRQFQVLKQLSEGRGVKEIALRLGISVKTAETHRAQLMKRLRIYDLAGLIRYALREKITRL